MEKTKIDKKKMFTKLFLSLIIILLFIAIIYLLYKELGINKIDEKKIQEYVSKTGIWAPLVFIIISFLQVTFIPIPGAITIIAGKYLFGIWLSFIYSYIGMLLGGIFAFYLGRIIGRSFVNWVVGDKATVDYYLTKLKGKEIVILFFMFLLPFFPDDALCAIAGITSISWLVFIFMQLITRFTSIGGTLLLLSGEFIPYQGWGLIFLIILSVLSLIAFFISYKKSEKINNWLTNMLNKMINKFKKDKNNKQK